jgi:hypothetical protein
LKLKIIFKTLILRLGDKAVKDFFIFLRDVNVSGIGAASAGSGCLSVGVALIPFWRNETMRTGLHALARAGAVLHPLGFQPKRFDYPLCFTEKI